MIFLETPWPILFCGIVVEAILVIMLLRSGRGVLLLPIMGVVAVVLLGLFIQQSVVTDTKLIHRTLEETCAALQANDAKRVLLQITAQPDGKTTQEAAKTVLSMVEFKDMSLRGVDTEINRSTPLPTAKVTFTVWVTGRYRGNDMMGEQSRPAKLKVTMRKEDGRWVIVDHTILQDPRQE
jgi:hypothetical protein